MRVKEKLIGATFNYTEDQNLAIRSILNEVSDGDLKTVLNSKLELITQIFNQVGYQNLRSFKQTVFNFERFYKKDFFEWKGDFDSEIFEKVLKAFLILSLENKKGIFDKEILNFKKNTDTEVSKKPVEIIAEALSESKGIDAQSFKQKYQMQLNEYIFSKNLWNQILNLNILNDEIINKELYEIYFRFKEDRPIWYKLWHYLDLKEADFKTLVTEAKGSIEKSELTNETDILHTISMLVYFKEKNLIFFSVESLLVLAVDQFKKIVKLKENIKELNFFDIRETSGGYGLYAQENPMFEEFIKNIAQAYKDKYIEKNIERIQELLSLMDNDTYEFYQQITGKYHDYPILNSLEPVDFIDQLLKIDYRNAMNAIDGLSSRYTTHSQNKIYLQEEDWFETIIVLANQKLALATMLEKHKIQDKFLPKLREIKQQAYKG